jgi:hypothetical protein
MKEKKQKAIELLNDVEEISDNDVHCGSWPDWTGYIPLKTVITPPCGFDPNPTPKNES